MDLSLETVKSDPLHKSQAGTAWLVYTAGYLAVNFSSTPEQHKAPHCLIE